MIYNLLYAIFTQDSPILIRFERGASVGQNVGKLTAQTIKGLGDGTHQDGSGLFLKIRGKSKTWTYRYQLEGRRRDMVLGKYPDMSLKEARMARNDAYRAKENGVDPIDARSSHREIATVSEMVSEAFNAIRGDLKRGGKAGRWMSPMNTHIIPKLGDKDVTSITGADIHATLAPIWRTKTSAAEKALQRLGIVLRHAAAKYPGQIDMSATVNARTLLGSQAHRVEHIPAMPWADVPAFYARLGTTGAGLALRMLILTAARSTPVRLATVDQFDADVWTVPGENMKSGDPFRIPLSSEAQRIVTHAAPLARGGYLFVGHRGKPLSDMSMTQVMKRAGLPYRPHGFRSSFRDWCADHGEDWNLAEVALDHRVGGKVQRSYQRSDLLDRRRPLMERWGAWVAGEQSPHQHRNRQPTDQRTADDL
ncbi:integrase arm-type DNA-binding domain-containing protein [Ruegeria sp. WL0004]|uniref:Integrase arm-type DNA-binding domain-containing protein n=1 Tax=Ruegeria marisflavi TaxID=2984152 RepID=A0ABT2WTC7_9RHOB|nr:integrase arm-type DNA-binding domain-containing protein [Ruegeria sp. WL0004]